MKVQQLAYAQSAMEILPHIDMEFSRPGAMQLGTVHFNEGQRGPSAGSTAHRQREISLILEGKLEVVAGGVQHIAGTGSLLDIPAGEEHYTKALEDTKVLYVLIG